MNEMTADEQACIEENGETLGEKTSEQYLYDLWQCVGDEMLLRYHTHFYGIRSFSMTTSTCIREGAGPIDLREMMMIGAPLLADSLVFGVMVQVCMTEEEGKQAWGTATPWDAEVYNREMAVLRCVFGKEGGVSRFLDVLRKHVGNDDDLIDAYNHEIVVCQQS